jgi:hypothetical protein
MCTVISSDEHIANAYEKCASSEYLRHGPVVALGSNCLNNVHHYCTHCHCGGENRARLPSAALARLLIHQSYVWPLLIVAAWRNGKAGHKNARFP